MILVIIATILCLFFGYLLLSFRKPKGYPPGPPWLPFVGNTPLIRKLARQYGGQHIVFERLAEYFKSPVVGLKLGNELVVVALTYPIVREVHVKEEFDGRPDTFFLRLRTMGTRLGITCTDGDLWSEHRNFVVRHLRQVGFGRTEMENQIQSELKELLDVIRQEEGKPAWPGTFLPPSVINILWTFVTGKRIARSDPRLSRLLQLLLERSKAFDMSGGILSQMPWLRFIAPEKTGYNLLQRFNKELNELFMETIEDHHATYTDEKSADDLIYGYIKEQKARQHDPNSTFTNLQLTMIILDIFIAGSQTTSITIDLALMMMLVRPDIQTTIHQEIQQTLANNQLPKYSDKVKLPYTEAVLLEVQRFFHIVPISGPRRATSVTTLGDYTIPKNTTVLMSLRSVHMDPDYWGDPEIFRPERFLDADRRKIVNTERLLPFGLARRRCLGEALARSCIFTFFVGILQRYQLMLPTDAPVPSIKLLPGITLSPEQYKIKFVTR